MRQKRQSLSDALHKLSREDPALVVRDNERLYKAEVETDVGELRNALVNEDLDGLEKHFHGPFLKGFEADGEAGGELANWIRRWRTGLADAAWQVWLTAAERAYRQGDIGLSNRLCVLAVERTEELPQDVADITRLCRLLEASRHPLRDWVAQEAAGLGIDLAGGAFGRRRSDRAAFVGVPARPLHLIGRQAELSALTKDLTVNSAPSVALLGMPGVGKTALALEVAHDPALLQRFPDGVLWGHLGVEGKARHVLEGWAGALGVDLKGSASDVERAQRLRNWAGYRKILFVVDDVCDALEANLLHCGGPASAHIFTTLSMRVAQKVARTVHRLKPISLKSSLDLLRVYAPDICAAELAACRSLASKIGGLPIALEAAAKYLVDRARIPTSRAAVVEALGESDVYLDLDRRDLDSHTVKTLQESLAQSLYGLGKKEEESFYALGAFAPEPDCFTLTAGSAVTGASAETLDSLVDRHLLELREDGLLQLHPVVGAWARKRTSDTTMRRFGKHYVEFAERHAGDWERLDAAYGQLRRAWQQAPGEARFKLLAVLAPYQSGRGHWRHQVDWVESLRNTTVGNSEQTTLFKIAGDALLNLAQYRRAAVLLSAAATLLRPVGGPRLLRVLESLTVAQEHLKNFAEVERLAEEVFNLRQRQLCLCS